MYVLIFNLLSKEVQNALEAASAKSKMRYYENKFNIYSKEYKLAESQNFCFNKMKEAAEKISITGLLSVRLHFKPNY